MQVRWSARYYALLRRFSGTMATMQTTDQWSSNHLVPSKDFLPVPFRNWLWFRFGTSSGSDLGPETAKFPGSDLELPYISPPYHPKVAIWQAPFHRSAARPDCSQRSGLKPAVGCPESRTESCKSQESRPGSPRSSGTKTVATVATVAGAQRKIADPENPLSNLLGNDIEVLGPERGLA